MLLCMGLVIINIHVKSVIIESYIQCCGSGSGMNNLDRISERLETIFWVEILKFFDAVPGWKKFGSGRKKYGSGINIPDPQHWLHIT
jgi:hypothetical protein